MKRLFIFTTMLLMGVLTFAQAAFTVSANSEDISQSLDLKVVAKLFAEASTTGEFEKMLNNPDSAFSNLDLNGDDQIDYLRVIETGSGNSRLIVIQAVLAKDIYQDVASIYVEKTSTGESSVQIIGDEYVYGCNYIIEPAYVYRPVIYVWLWDLHWHPWRSPWSWGYYPNWWYHRHCYAHHWYHNRCYRFHHHHHICSFHHGHQPHHGYHDIHSGVSRRDYATRHPNTSYQHRNMGSMNARDINRTNVQHRSTVTKEPNQTLRTTHSTVQQRTGSQTQRAGESHGSGRQPGNISTSRTHQTGRTVNANRTGSTIQPRPSGGHRTTSSVQSTQRASSRTTNSSFSGQRSSGSAPSRGGGSYRGGGSSPSRSSGGSPSKGGGNSGSHRR